MTVNEKDGKVTIALEGIIHINNAAQTEKELFDAVKDKTGEIVIDAKKLDYISSAGLRCIRNVYMKLNKKGGKLSIIHVNENVMEVFEMTGIAGLLGIKS